jgi:hypothetical protein
VSRKKQKLSPHVVRITEKALRAVELRKQGLSFEAIAKQCGYNSQPAAYMAVKAALQRSLREPAEELRTLEAKRLDTLLAGIWGHAIAGELSYVDRVLTIMQRRATLLGLDKPFKVAETTPEGTALPSTPATQGIADEFVLGVAHLLAQYGQLGSPQNGTDPSPPPE